MSMDLVRDVLAYLLEQLKCKTKLTAKNMWTLSMSTVEQCSIPLLLILDEVDELLSSSDMENVYKLLEWPHQSANLLTIGKTSLPRKSEVEYICFCLWLCQALPTRWISLIGCYLDYSCNLSISPIYFGFLPTIANKCYRLLMIGRKKAIVHLSRLFSA